jgi:hypothetical protein
MYLHFIFRKNDNLLHHTLNKLAFFDGAEAALDGDNNLEVLARPHLRLQSAATFPSASNLVLLAAAAHHHLATLQREQLYDLILGELDAYSRSLVI